MATQRQDTRGRQITRRQLLTALGLGGTGLLLAGCGAAPDAPAGQASQAPAGVASTGASAAGGAAVAPGQYDDWRLGTVDPSFADEFRAFSWEGEGEMRKWLLHLESYMQAEYPAATLQITWGVPWAEYWTKLPTTITGGDAPDLAWMHDTRVQSFASRDQLQPLDDYIQTKAPDGWPDEFYESQVKAFQYDGKQYAIPYDWAPGGLYINLDMLEQAGLAPPTETTTLDELLAMAQKLSRPEENIYGLNLGFGFPAGLYWVFRSFGADWYAPDLSKGTLDSAESIEAVQWLVDLRLKHKVAPLPENMQGVDNPFSQGLAAINWSLNDEAFVVDELVGEKFKWDVAPSPTGSAGRFQFVGGSGWSIPKGAKNPDLAYELTRFTLSNPEILPTTAKMGSMFVSRADQWEHAMPGPEMHFNADSYKHAFYDLGKQDGVVPVYHPRHVEWEALWSRYMEPLFIGENTDVAGTMKAFNEDTTKLLQELKTS